MAESVLNIIINGENRAGKVFDDVGKSVNNLSTGLAKIGGAALLGGVAIAGAGIAILGKELVDSVQAAAEAQDIQSQLNAVLQSTGGVAGVTAQQVNQLADSLGKTTKFEDDAIVSGESLLLTFTGIGKDVFPDATKTMLDMSQALGQDLKSSAIQLGKALNNPEQGLTALTRVGVTFTDEQKKMVEQMTKTGDLAGAQKVILAELQKEFGGSAEAAGKTFSGQLTILKNNLGNVKETIGTALLPVLSQLSTKLIETLNKPEVQASITKLAEGIANFASKVVAYIPVIISGFQNLANFLTQNKGIIVGILAALGVAIGVFVWTTAVPAIVGLVTAFAPVIAVMVAIGAAVGLLYTAWTNNWGGMRTTITSFWEGTLLPAFQQIKQWFEVNIPVAVQFLSNIWSTVLLPALSAVWTFISTVFLPILSALGTVVSAVLNKAVEVLVGLWQNGLLPALNAVWDVIQNSIIPFFTDLANVVSSVLTPPLEWLTENVLDPLAGAFGSIETVVKSIVTWLEKLATSISNLKLPDWLTPGSPTPFEIGLRGINKELKKLNATETQFAFTTNGIASGRGGMNSVKNEGARFYNPTFQIIANNPNDLFDQLQAMSVGV